MTTECTMTLNQAISQFEPMVHSIVKNAPKNSVCNYEDLTQEGLTAICIAYNTYDPTKGTAFSTWVYHMIHDHVMQFEKENLSCLSGGWYLQDIIRKIKKENDNDDISVEELMKRGVSRKTASAAAYVNNATSTVPYEDIDVFFDNHRSNEIDAIDNRFDWESHLNSEEIQIIRLFFGFDEERQSAANIAKRMGKSRRQVMYCMGKAIAKLRHVRGIEEYAP